MLNIYRNFRKIESNILKEKNRDYKRDDYYNINWNNKVIWIFWERWVGKTTILVQKRIEKNNSFYFSADNASIKANWLFDFIMFCFENFEIETFFIDEIFKYSNWKQELKNIIDSFPQLNIIFSWSSSMALYDWVIDLWRRVYDYKVNTLSFREFLNLKYKLDLKKVSIDDILNNHMKISIEYSLKIKQVYFKQYLKTWAYPFWIEVDEDSFINLLQKTLNRIILEDLQYIKNYQTQSLDKLSKMIYFIANTTPSELSINHLSKKIWIDKNIVDNVLFLLSKIWTINLVQKWEKLSEKVRKEYKIFLWDTNKYFVNNLEPNKWIIREAFFVSELKKIKDLEITLPKIWDFKVEYKNNNYNFEVWWKSKKQKKYPNNYFIVKDDIQISENEKIIPLWVFWLIN